MKTSLNWLKDYVAFELSPKDLAHRLTLSGSEVEKEERVGKDTVFELEITPNRPDCLNVLGLAREVSAILNKPLKTPKVKKIKFPSKDCSIMIEDKKDCCRYIGAILTDVKIAPSSAGMRARLSAIGLRPVNNAVDITNFCLMETGQPLHAFDLDKLAGGKIIVRRARAGEKIRTIDDKEHALDPSILVIADEKRPVAIAGIMGGKDTEVTEKTKNILLESAYFNAGLVRRAARKLGIRTDASYRFERGVDMDTVEKGMARAIGLIVETAGGQPLGYKDNFPAKSASAKKKSAAFVVDLNAVNAFLGSEVPRAKAVTILTKLGFKVAPAGAGGKVKVQTPGFRSDVKSEVDVAEEIGRIVGYDRLALKLPQIKSTNAASSPLWAFKEKLAQLCCGLGLDQAISYALLSPRKLEASRLKFAAVVRNQNPLTEDQKILRPSLLPCLLDAAATNFKRGNKDLKLFEIGKIYLPSGEKDVLAVLVSGVTNDDWRTAPKRRADLYDIKGICEEVLARARVRDFAFLGDDKACFEPGEAVKIVLSGAPIGSLGKVSAEALSSWDIKHQDVFYAELLIGPLLASAAKIIAYQEISEYPPVVRDISLALPSGVTFDKVCATARAAGEALMREIRFVEQYLGEKIPAGHQGLTLSVVYRSDARTLTETEVEEAHQRICARIASDLHAIKR